MRQKSFVWMMIMMMVKMLLMKCYFKTLADVTSSEHQQMLFSGQCLYKDEEGERVQHNEQMMKHHPGLRSRASAALTILSGLL